MNETLVALGFSISALVVLALAVRDMRACSRARLKYRRLGLRKQDWTPREDPALWRKS